MYGFKASTPVKSILHVEQVLLGGGVGSLQVREVIRRPIFGFPGDVVDMSVKVLMMKRRRRGAEVWHRWLCGPKTRNYDGLVRRQLYSVNPMKGKRSVSAVS